MEGATLLEFFAKKTGAGLPRRKPAVAQPVRPSHTSFNDSTNSALKIKV